MKLGSAYRSGAEGGPTSERFPPLPPGYRLLGRIGPGHRRDGVDLADDDGWRAEGPGGFRVRLTVVRPRLGAARTSGQRATERWRPEDLAEARHPNLVPVFGCWRIDGCLVLVSELAERTLQDRLLEVTLGGGTGIDRDELLEALWEAARAVDYLGSHARFGGHGQVRPWTLRVVGGGVQLDAPIPPAWGATSTATDRASARGAALAYTAPELFRGASVSARADQFSLAAVYCYLRGARHPFPDLDLDGRGGPHRSAQMFNRRPDLDMLSALERPAVARALEEDPARRWGSCRALIEALRLDVAGQGGSVQIGADAGRQSARSVEDEADGPDRGRPGTRPVPRGLAAATGLTAVAATLALAPLGVPSTSQVRSPASGSAPAPRVSVAGPSSSKFRLADAEAEVGPTPESTWEPRSEDLALLASVGLAVGHSGEEQVGPPSGPTAKSGGPGGPAVKPSDPPGAAEAARRRGDALLEAGQFGPAVEAYAQALETAPRDADARHGRGLARYGLGDHLRALADLDAAAGLSPRDPSVLNNRGLARLATGDLPGATADFEAASKLGPPNVVTRYNLGRALAQAGESVRAIAEFDTVLKVDPTYAKAWKARADARARLGDQHGALADFDQAVRLRPEDDATLNNRGLVLLGLDQPERALADLDAAARLRPRDPVVLSNRGRILARLGRDREAVAAFDEALHLDPARPHIWRARAEVYRRLGDLPRSAADLAEADRLGTDGPRASR